MAKAIAISRGYGCDNRDHCDMSCQNFKCGCIPYEYAEILYNAGYRKQNEVTREIFEEIKYCMSCFEDDDDGYLLKKCEFEFFMRELEKKYTEE